MVGGSVPGIASPVGAAQMFFVSVSVSALKEHSMEFWPVDIPLREISVFYVKCKCVLKSNIH